MANHNRSLAFPTLACVLLSSFPIYHYGKPWLNLHQQNVVAYDCKIMANLIPIGSKYPGRISEVHCKLGDLVNAGDVIAEMDSREIDVEIQRSMANIELAVAKLDAHKIAIEKSLKTVLAEQTCLNAKVKVTQRRSTAIKTETNWIEKKKTRAERLYRKKSLAASDMEEILRELDSFTSQAEIAAREDEVARLDLASMQSKVEEIKAKSEQLNVIEQEIELAKAALRSAQEKKDAALVRCENTGTVTEIFCGPGSSIRIGDPIVQVQPQELWCEGWIDESDFNEIAIGDRASIRLNAISESEIDGVVDAILPRRDLFERSMGAIENPVLRQESKLFLKFSIESSGQKLTPGLSGIAYIPKSGTKPQP